MNALNYLRLTDKGVRDKNKQLNEDKWRLLPFSCTTNLCKTNFDILSTTPAAHAPWSSNMADHACGRRLDGRLLSIKHCYQDMHRGN